MNMRLCACTTPMTRPIATSMRSERRTHLRMRRHYAPLDGSMRVTLSFAFLLALSVPAVAAPLVPLPPQPVDVPWPTREWPTGPLPATVDQAKLDAALAATEHDDGPLGETREIVIIHHGRLVAEKYKAGYSAQTRLISWS